LSELNKLAFPVALLESAIDKDDRIIFLATRSSVIIDDPRFSAEQIPYDGGFYFENLARKDLLAFKCR
jgi:hypothetical protein